MNTQEERFNNIKHCKWVDEIVCPCPWFSTEKFLDKHDIDYVAHDDIPYEGCGLDDVYGEIKRIGRFKAT